MEGHGRFRGGSSEVGPLRLRTGPGQRAVRAGLGWTGSRPQRGGRAHRCPPGVGRVVQLSRAGFENFCAGIGEERCRCQFSICCFPQNSLSRPPLSLPAPPTSPLRRGSHCEGRVLSAAGAGVGTERSGRGAGSPLQASPARWARPAGVKVGARVPRPPAGMSAQPAPPARPLAPRRHREKVAVRDGAAAMTTPAVGARLRRGCSREEGGAEAGGGR